MNSPSSRPLTISQINQLGRRLRKSATVSTSDLQLLQQLLTDHAYVLAAVQERLRAHLPNTPATPRLKTISTIVDKLKREPTMALSRMRDIAGARIVADMNRIEQDVLVGQVREAGGGGKVIDRRARPVHGYRAVHIEARFQGRLVEIQIRTAGQDQWAQIVEKLGDSWGRQIRYGGLPPEPDLDLGGGWSRGRIWGLVLSLGDVLDAVEREEAEGLGRELSADEQVLLGTNRREMQQVLADIASSLASPEPL